jgi:4'-phosphopantetheinyl transferase EntD
MPPAPPDDPDGTPGAGRRSDRSVAAMPRWPSPFPPDVAFCQAGAGDAASRHQRSLLPPERALLGERAAPRRVLEFTLGRGCARAALAALVPARAEELAATPILRADARRPLWPEGIVGSITHHRGSAAAAVARAADYVGIGLDVEALRRPTPALLRRILRPEERERWQALPPAAQAAAFVGAFSAKESVFKALYPVTGLYLGFQDATVALDVELAAGAAPGSGPVALRWRLQREAGGGFPAGYAGQGCALLRDGYVLTAVWVRC